jgi:hypothetical protein
VLACLFLACLFLACLFLFVASLSKETALRFFKRKNGGEYAGIGTEVPTIIKRVRFSGPKPLPTEVGRDVHMALERALGHLERIEKPRPRL